MAEPPPTHKRVLDLSGADGGVRKLGMGDPSATLSINALYVSIMTSERDGYDQAARSKASTGGGVALAERVLRNL